MSTTDRRQDILQAALRLFLENGVAGTSTGSISRAAGVSTGLLFHHFGSKAELVRTLYHDIAVEATTITIDTKGADLDEDITTYEHGLRHAVDAYIDWALADWDKFQFLRIMDSSPGLADEDSLDRPGRSEYRKILEDRAENAVRNNQLKPYLFSFALEFSLQMLVVMVDFLHNHPQARKDPEVRDQMWSYYWDAMRTR
jgi:AcrR family transcriptional regulator